jgi:hypothetical protein
VTGLLLIELVLCVIALLAVMRVWRASALEGLLTLLVPCYVYVAMVRHWNDPDHGIRWHVLALTLGGALMFWYGQGVMREMAAEQIAMEAAAQQDEDGTFDAAEDDDGAAPTDAATTFATIEIGPAPRVAARAQAEPAPAQAAAPVAPTAPDPPLSSPAGASGDTDRAPAAVRPSLRQALAAAVFQRGRFERPGAGFAIDLPHHFHALAAVDARRIEAALGEPYDPRELAWIVHERIALDDPSAWHVRVRRLELGRVVAPARAADPVRLLLDAQHASASRPVLAGTRGALIGYAVAPTFADGIVDWVEERVADDGAGSVLDCHALRSEPTGVVEFSIVAAAPGLQVVCDASVRLLAQRTALAGSAAPAAAPTSAAAYTLADVVARLH